MSEELSRYFPCPETVKVQKDESGVFNLSISKLITVLKAFSSENLSPTKINIRLIEAEGHEEHMVSLELFEINYQEKLKIFKIVLEKIHIFF